MLYCHDYESMNGNESLRPSNSFSLTDEPLLVCLIVTRNYICIKSMYKYIYIKKHFFLAFSLLNALDLFKVPCHGNSYHRTQWIQLAVKL